MAAISCKPQRPMLIFWEYFEHVLSLNNKVILNMKRYSVKKKKWKKKQKLHTSCLKQVVNITIKVIISIIPYLHAGWNLGHLLQGLSQLNSARHEGQIQGRQALIVLHIQLGAIVHQELQNIHVVKRAVFQWWHQVVENGPTTVILVVHFNVALPLKWLHSFFDTWGDNRYDDVLICCWCNSDTKKLQHFFSTDMSPFYKLSAKYFVPVVIFKTTYRHMVLSTTHSANYDSSIKDTGHSFNS